MQFMVLFIPAHSPRVEGGGGPGGGRPAAAACQQAVMEAECESATALQNKPHPCPSTPPSSSSRSTSPSGCHSAGLTRPLLCRRRGRDADTPRDVHQGADLSRQGCPGYLQGKDIAIAVSWCHIERILLRCCNVSVCMSLYLLVNLRPYSQSVKPSHPLCFSCSS